MCSLCVGGRRSNTDSSRPSLCIPVLGSVGKSAERDAFVSQMSKGSPEMRRRLLKIESLSLHLGIIHGSPFVVVVGGAASPS